MTENNIFFLPDVGEGLTEADIVEWKVEPGQVVEKDQIVVEIETAKSLVELPIPFAGVVSELVVPSGTTADVGEPIIKIIPHDGQTHSSDDVSSETVSSKTEEKLKPLVGSGPKADSGTRRQKKTSHQTKAVVSPARQVSVDKSPQAQEDRAVSQSVFPENTSQHPDSSASYILAKPPVRKTARDMGVNLSEVSATGRRGEITRKDLENYVNKQKNPQDTSAVNSGSVSEESNFWNGSSDVIPVTGVRKATAKAMVESAFNAPHVSIFVDVDASRTMEFVKKLKESRDFEGIKVSPLLIMAKAIIWATARNPEVNATWAGDEILVYHYMNLGIAAATGRGLIVPNIKNAQELSLRELAIALNTLASTAREGKTTPAEMQNGTMTITNIGALGIDTGTPIINPGEVSIVAFGTIKQKPWVLDGEVLPRWVTTLGGSFDHRVVDGDLSARFMADVASVLEEPALLLE